MLSGETSNRRAAALMWSVTAELPPSGCLVLDLMVESIG